MRDVPESCPKAGSSTPTKATPIEVMVAYKQRSSAITCHTNKLDDPLRQARLQLQRMKCRENRRQLP
jgi:hypothetical protein